MSLEKEQYKLDINYYENEYNFNEMEETVKKICSTSEVQFNQIKDEKWYTRFFDLVTLSKKNEKRLAQQIVNVSQAQQVTMEVLMLLSKRDVKVMSLLKDSFEQIEQLMANDIKLAKKLNQLKGKFSQLEKRSLYGLDNKVDIKLCSEIEREIISGFLCNIAHTYGPLNNDQKQYFLNILKYIEVHDPQTTMKLETIDEISDKNIQQAILRTGLELMFLKENNFDFMDDFDEVLDNFSVNRKAIKQIEESITNIYNIIGTEGFFERFNSYSVDELYEEDTIELEVEESDQATISNYEDSVDECNEIGNTLHNLRQGGLMAIQGDYIYYSDPEKQNNLFRSKLDGTEKILLTDDEATSINVLGNFIYYLLPNGIFRVDINGKNRTKIYSTTSLNSTVLFMIVDIDNIYIVSDNGLYKFKQSQNQMEKIITISDINMFKSASEHIIGFNNENIYFKSNYSLFYKYNKKNGIIDQFAQTRGWSCDNPIFMNNKLYYKCYKSERFLFTDMFYYKIEKNDLTNHVVTDIIQKTYSSDWKEEHGIPICNMNDDYVYYINRRLIKRYSPDKPQNKVEVYSAKEGEVENLHIINDKLFFIEKKENQRIWKSVEI